MDVGFACCGSHADRLVLEHPSKAAHGVSFEVGKVDHEVVVGEMVTYDVVFQVLLVAHGNTHLSVFVHQVEGSDGVESVSVDGLPVLAHVLPAASVSRAALHECAVRFVHKIADKSGLQVVVATHLAGTDLDGHSAVCLHSESLVDAHERFG